MLNNLRVEVMEILDNMAVMNGSTVKQEAENVVEYGCVSGYVSALMYYYQTEAFFNRHKEEINEMVHEMSEDIYGNPYELYKNFRFECSKNTLAWFGFEEICYIIANEEEEEEEEEE